MGNISVVRLTHRDYFAEMIESGEDAIRFLEGPGGGLLKETPVYKRLYRLLKSDAVLLALKKGVVTYLKDRIHFLKIAALLAEDPRRRVLVVPAYEDIFLEPLCRFLKVEDRVILPPELRRPSRLMERLDGLRQFVYAVAGVPFRITRNFFKTMAPLTIKAAVPKEVQWAKPIVVGLGPDPPAACTTVRTDDNLEDDTDFKPAHFLYVYGLYRFPAQTIAEWRQRIEARGAQFVDTLSLRMPLGFYVTRKLTASWQRLLWCATGLLRPGHAKVCEVGHTVVESYVDAELFMQYHRPRVTDVRDEYLSGHIIRTIVFNRYGCKTIGIHHGSYSSKGLNPSQAYSYCNIYCAYGPGYFDHTWNGLWDVNPRRVSIGVENNTYVYRAARQESRRAAFAAKYGLRKVLLYCPPHWDILSRPEMIEEALRVIVDFSRAHPDWNVVVRPRPRTKLLYTELLARSGAGAGLGIDFEFSTYELIAFSDAVVAPNLSTVGIEAICAGKGHVLFVNYWGRWDHPYRRYSPDLVVSSSKELAARLEAWAGGAPGHEPAVLQAFRRDFDVGFDGRALERYKDQMRSLARFDGNGGQSDCRSVFRERGASVEGIGV